MNTKQALDILIAVAICSTRTSENDLTCSDCPFDEYECERKKSWTDKEAGEAIRLLKDVQVADPNPAIPGKWMLVKMLSVHTEPGIICPVDDIQLRCAAVSPSEIETII